MRVAVLWPGLSGYVNACLKELARRPQVDLLVAYAPAVEEAPFNDAEFGWIPESVRLTSRPDRAELLRRVGRFKPDVLLVVSWHIPAFRYVLRHLDPRPLRVLCMDNQWHGTLKQRLGVLSSRWYLHPLYDAVFLPGERQACFAQRLGFPSNRVWRGLYCPDNESFARASTGAATRPPSFGYLGRLTTTKGITDLLQAYELYRSVTADPWDLAVAGAGPLAGKIALYQGVKYSDFVQPRDIPTWLASIGCLVVPSRFEPWGVVIAEAAASGLPIIATEACGAGPHLVHDFVNGRIADTASVQSLAECMEYVSSATGNERATMGQISRSLASVYTPARWADTVLGSSARLIERGVR
jgi:glycosyltransferase involved in cell wall biosynthesis